jgi:uncharacterized protein involved in outer membrane biogenesis
VIKKLLLIGATIITLLILTTVAVRLWLGSDAIRIAIERQASAALGTPVKIGSATATVFPRLGLDLREVQIGEPAEAQVERFWIATGFDLLVNRRVEDADIHLSGGHVNAEIVAGLGALAAPQSAVESGPLTIVSIRSIRLDDVIVVAGTEQIPTDLAGSLNGDRFEVSSLTLDIGGHTVRIEGVMTSLARLEGEFTIRAQTLPLDELVGALGGVTAAGTKGDGRPFRVTAAISAPTATLSGLSLQSFESRLEATRAALVLDPLSFTIHNGRVEARMSANPAAADSRFQIRGRVAGMDVAGLQEATESGKKITGRLDAQFALQATPQRSFATLLGAARGDVTFEIRDGRLPGIEAVRETVIRFANRAQTAAPVEATDQFNLLRAAIVLRPGPAAVRALTLNTADLDVTGSGTYDLPTGRLALSVDVILSEALSQQAGRDLYRYAREDKRIVLPASIGGTLAQPATTIDLGRAIGRGLQNRIEEELRSIFDKAIKQR